MRNERQESLEDILEESRSGEFARLADRIKAAHFRECEALREERNRAGLTARKKLEPRIRELEAENARLRAALAKISAVTTRHYAARNLGDKGRRAVAEIMSACRFADGALDEYERAFADNARLRAALKPVLECKVRSAMAAETEPGRSDYCANIIEKAQRVYNESNESEEMK